MSGFSKSILIGKVVGQPKQKGDTVLLNLNIAEQVRKEGQEPEWKKNVVSVFVKGEYATARAGKLQDGDRVMTIGMLDVHKWTVYDADGEQRRSRLIQRAFAVRDGISENENMCIVVGRLGGDAEKHTFDSGAATLRFNVAFDKRENIDGEWKDVGVWVPVRIVGNRAKTAGQVLKKGTSVAIEGKITTDTWTDKDGATQSMTYLKAFDFAFTGAGAGGNRRDNSVVGDDDIPELGFDDGPPDDYYAQNYGETPKPATAPSGRGPAAAGPPNAQNRAPQRTLPPPADLDDEIPF